MQESLDAEHGRELLTNALEELLDGGGVTNEGRRHLKATGGNGAESSLDVVGDPLNEVGGVLVLDVAHLVINLLHGDLTTAGNNVRSCAAQTGTCMGNLQDGRASEVATVAEVRGSHHVLGVEHLLGELRDADSTERVSATAGQGSKADHEEVKTGERNHVDGELAEIRVQLTGETQASGNTRHDGGDKVVKITVRGVGELEGLLANVVEGLVVNAEGLVGVLNELVDGEGGVVRLNNGVGRARLGKDGEGSHHAVGELLTDLGDQQSTHTGTGTTTERVGDLETLEAVTAFGLTADNVEDVVDELGTLSVVTLGPVVASTRLTEDEVVGAEKLAERTSTDSLHGSGLKIDEDGAGNVLVAGSLHGRLVVMSGRRGVGSELDGGGDEPR